MKLYSLVTDAHEQLVMLDSAAGETRIRDLSITSLML